MKVLSLDIETTAIEPKEGRIIQIGMIKADTNERKPLEELEHIELNFKPNEIWGNYDTFLFNQELMKYIASSQEVYVDEELFHEDYEKFLKKDRYTLIGKNVGGFDVPWLKFHQFETRQFRHRSIDTGQLWMRPDDEMVPNTDQVFERAGLTHTPNHTALADAYDSLQLIWKYNETR